MVAPKITAAHDIVKDVTISGTATHTSPGLNLEHATKVSVWYRATSATAPNIRIFYQTSYNDVPANYTRPTDVPDIVTSLTNSEVHMRDISPPVSSHIRIVVSGNTGNPADTVANVKIIIQE